ncbi:MAG: carbon monoxide dehydrogenase subunit [Pseudonocardiales bacterium]|nr:carbon monoxide dehydrogenase subunit [Pseudonocardiales bacterium]
MDLVDTFVLPLPIDRAWDLLLDLERIAPCMPGAQLTEIEGDEHRGKVKIKVGPITAQFAGQARFTEKDAGTHRAVITAEGREARGQGNANAVVTASLTAIDGPHGPGTSTKVEVVTDLTISGKVAQFGRGVIADVSSKLISQFVANVEKMVNEDNAAPAEAHTGTDADAAVLEETPVEQIAPSAPIELPTDPIANEAPVEPAVPTVRKIHSAEAEPVDLFGLTGAPVAKRLAPIAGIAALIAILVVWRRRHSG